MIFRPKQLVTCLPSIYDLASKCDGNGLKVGAFEEYIANDDDDNGELLRDILNYSVVKGLIYVQ